MSDVVIRAENLSKRYAIGHGPRYSTLRDALAGAARAPFRALRSNGNRRNGADDEFIWALKDVSFEVRQGEIVGIIGRNGAGKSTLLKILSRITDPTSGHAEIRGRVGSLLEVGTGFHPELTGRENVFLNGAILGMRKAEIARKFDEIVAFAEVEKFIDTPVKHYSSGMYVRLAFAVAAHLDPEILIIDEVLAVGDAAFQKKCLGKMGDITKQGRTMLFVSHNITFIEAICGRAFLLDNGQVIDSGKAHNVAAKYNAMWSDRSEVCRVQTNDLYFAGIQNRTDLDGINGSEDLAFRIALRTGARHLSRVHLDFALVNERGEWVVHSRNKFVGDGFDFEANTAFELSYTIKAPMLAPGHYFLIVYAISGEELLWIENIDACTVSARAYFGAGEVIDGARSAILPPFELELRKACISRLS